MKYLKVTYLLVVDNELELSLQNNLDIADAAIDPYEVEEFDILEIEELTQDELNALYEGS